MTAIGGALDGRGWSKWESLGASASPGCGCWPFTRTRAAGHVRSH